MGIVYRRGIKTRRGSNDAARYLSYATAYALRISRVHIANRCAAARLALRAAARRILATSARIKRITSSAFSACVRHGHQRDKHGINGV